MFSIFKHFRFWAKYRAKPETQQGDLFVYASQERKKIEKKKLRGSKTISQKSKRKGFLLLSILPFLVLASFTGGYLIGEERLRCEIKRKAFIYPFRKRGRSSYIQALQSGRLYLMRAEEEEDPHYDPFDSGGAYIELDQVRRIDLFPPPETLKRASSRKLRVDEKRFLGRYRIRMSQHRGLFYIFPSRKGGLGASVRFTNWGKQRMEFLKSVRVWKNKIYFRRSCRGKRCSEIGAGHVINQKFEGRLSSDRKKITGTYTGDQSHSRWQALRY